ncbi:MAG: Rrf2 family transcriptional regulator [Thiohalomonadaceae bacterium]
MHITQHTDYALRVLILLALRKEKVTIAQIAEHFAISQDHLRKVVHRLGMLGYVKTARGKQGGLTLAMAPAQVNVGQVLRDFEPHFDMVECFNARTNHCALFPECGLQGALREATARFLATLDGYTLADLLHAR